jgi:hypothetical protein
MSQVPLPKTSTLRYFGLKWLADKLDPVSDPEPPAEAEDEAEREHECTEAARTMNEERRKLQHGELEMSKVIVPVHPHEMTSLPPRSSTRHQPPPPMYPPAAVQRHIPRIARRRSPSPKPEPETMIVPDSPSPMSSSFELAGSEYVVRTKVELYPHERERVARELKEAIECDFFKMWPTYEDSRPVPKAIRRKNKGKEVERRDTRRSDPHTLEDRRLSGETALEKQARMNASVAFVKDMDEDGKEERDRIARDWKAKDERSTEGRTRFKGGYGYESVVEKEALMGTSEWGFKPTLGGVYEDRMDEKQEKRRDSNRTSSSDSTRERDVSTARYHRDRKSSIKDKGKQTGESSTSKEDPRTSSKSQPKHKHAFKAGSINQTQSKAAYRPKARAIDRKIHDDSDDEYFSARSRANSDELFN